MPPTYFKFTTPEGINRRLTFSEPPDWPLLASKLNALYGIPLNQVGVSYVDNDNDEITVSSDEELQDFYKVSHQTGQVIKLAVIDLQNNAGKSLDFLSLNRTPFDGDAFELVGEWERFPPIIVTEEISTSGPHAFVEVLDSSVTHDEMDTDTEDDHSTAQPRILNKGKGRSLSFGAASITSVLGEETSHKHPIHVYDLNSRKDDKDKGSDHIHVPAQSTPKVQVQNVDDNRDTEETPAPSKAVEVEDPPLPSLDESPASSISASLFHDLASLVHDVTQVVSSHPELSEGLRNIGRNMSDGTYWTTHREAFSDAVNGMFNPTSTEQRRQAEEVAATRLTDMIGKFFRTLSQVPVNTEDTRAPNINENPPDQSGGEDLAHAPPPRRNRMHPFGSFAPRRGLRGSRHHGYFPPYGSFPHGPHTPGYIPHIPPIPPVHHPVRRPPAPHGWPHGRQGPPRPPSYPSPHGPPPVPSPPHIPVGPSPRRSSVPTYDNSSSLPGPPLVPSPPADAPAGPPHHASLPTYDHISSPLPPLAQGHVRPPAPPSVPPANGGSVPIPEPQPRVDPSGGPPDINRRQSYHGSFASVLPISNDPSNQSNAQDLRAEVEAVKRIYKDVKGRYRQERNQRRLEKLARKPTVRYSVMYVPCFLKYFCAYQGYRVDSAPVVPPENPREHEASSVQVQDPEAERVGTPRRSNTHLGHGPFRHLDKKPEDLTSRTIGRIAKKFSDVSYDFDRS